MTAEPFRCDQACVILLLGVTLSYQWWLCLLQGFGLPISAATVAAAEMLILAACMPFLLKRMAIAVIVIGLVVMGGLMTMAVLREGYVDIKAIRDIVIPLLFVWLGSNLVWTPEQLDRLLYRLIAVVLCIGFVELIFFDAYTRVINTFTFYVSTGGINALGAQMSDQSVTLNGLRPADIGRTVLPGLLGNHRAASVFLEPVSFGNFAVITFAWALSRPRPEWRAGVLLAMAALLMVALADSRFALYSFAILALFRLLSSRGGYQLAAFVPLLCMVLLWIAANLIPMGRDDLLGRLSSSGYRLQILGVSGFFGLHSFATDFGDAGYAYVFSRFGLPLICGLWIVVFMTPLRDSRATNYRALIAVYIALILCISGTSLFALKTSALLWFLFGAVATFPVKREGHAAAAWLVRGTA